MPSSTTVVLTKDMAVRVQGQPFGIVGGSLTEIAGENECGDTESGDFERHKPGRRRAEVAFDFYEKSDQDTFAAPLGLGVGSYAQVWVYTKGLDNPPWKFPNLCLYQYKDGFAKDGKLEGNLSGKHDGQYFRPGEA